MKIENKIWFGVIMGAIIVLVVSIVYYAATRPEEEDAPTSPTVVLEGNTINYTYTIYIGGWDGPVFDTSEEQIKDDDSIPKAVSYTYESRWPPDYRIGVPGDFDPTKFETTLGNEFPTLENEIKNKQEGDRIEITILAEDGIEYHDELKIMIPVKEKIPLYQTIDEDQFIEMFGDEAPIPDTVLTHPFWKWEVIIEEVAPNMDVTLYNQPYPGFKIDSLPWACEVEAISSEEEAITIKHDISDSSLVDQPIKTIDYILYNERLSEINETVDAGIITHIGGDYIILDFNDERAGKDIYIDIEIIRII